MSIKMKILVPMIVSSFVLVAAILCSNILQFSAYVDTTMETQVNSASYVASKELEALKTQANAVSLYIAEDREVIEALEKKDRDALISLAGQMQRETGVDFCIVTNASGIALARSNDPDRFGDDLSTKDCIKHALSGRSFTAIAESPDIAFSARSGAPVFNSYGVLVGVVSTGFRLDTNAFVDSIKSILGCEVTIFLRDERISTTVVKEDGTRAVGTRAAENVSKTVLAGNEYSGNAQILNRDALTKYIPVLGADRTAIGMLFVGRYLDEKVDTVWSFVRVGLLITLILMAVLTPAIIIVARRIIRPVNTMVEAARALAVGDTDISVQVDTRDEMRELANAFNDMIDNTQKQVGTIEAIAAGDLTVSVEMRSDKDVMNQALISMLNNNNEVFSQIVVSADQVSQGARQIADSSQVLAQGASEQAATVEQLSTAIGEVDVKTKDSAEMARQAADLAGRIKDNAEKGSRQMDRMVKAVKEINDASLSINKIIKVIDDIAFQTNILALNAAVEAARAGQHGKGFAVVADEVRNLAAKSAEAAKETGSLIENSMAKSELGARIADETAASLGEIVSGINESGRIVGEISRSSEHQSSAITQIDNSIGQVTQVVQQNSATAQQSAAASEEMSGQAELLQGLVSRFKLKKDPDMSGWGLSYPQTDFDTAFSLSADM